MTVIEVQDLVSRVRAPVPVSEALSQRELEVPGLVARGATTGPWPSRPPTTGGC